MKAHVIRDAGKADGAEVDGVVLREDREPVSGHHAAVRQIVFAGPGKVGGGNFEAARDATGLTENVETDWDYFSSNAVAGDDG